MKRASLMFVLTMGIATLASAQATRTWVSGVGDDANPCSRTAPCKTFAGAISKTASPGIINCLDPGGFGAVTITKSITIDCTGTMGSVLSSGVQGVIVNGTATDKVVLRAIDINGAGTTLGTNGVNYIQAASVALYDVNIANYSTNAVTVTSTSGAHKLHLTSCQILNSFRGLNLAPTGSTVDADVDGTNFDNITPGFGIDVVSANCTATVHDSTFTHSAGGLQVQNGTGSASLNNCMLSHNTTGVFGGAEVRLNNCSITNNGTGVSGTTRGFQSNMIIGNTAGNTVTTSVIGQ
jgi:hypothetical protein